MKYDVGNAIHQGYVCHVMSDLIAAEIRKIIL